MLPKVCLETEGNESRPVYFLALLGSGTKFILDKGKRNQMKFVELFRNPKAGKGEHTKRKPMSRIRKTGFGCSYYSTEKKVREKRIPDERRDYHSGGEG